MASKNKKEEAPVMTPVAPLGIAPVNRKKQVHEPPYVPAVQPPSIDAIRKMAMQWAESCGLRPPFMVSGPDREDYPRHGHGFVVKIQEQSGRNTMGTARFTETGKPSMWTVDGSAGV